MTHVAAGWQMCLLSIVASQRSFRVDTDVDSTRFHGFDPTLRPCGRSAPRRQRLCVAS